MNDADPLAQLRDIHLPPPIGWWPLAPGWWLLGAIILVAFAIGGIWFVRRYRQRRYRGFALQQLRTLHRQWQTDRNDAAFAQATNRLLKQCALAAFPRSDVAALSGAEWLEFLDRHLRKPRFTDPDLRALATLYQPASHNVSADTLHDAASHWIRRHRC